MTVMGFILITIVIIAALSMLSGNKTKKKSAKVNQKQMKFQRKMEMEFNKGTRESSSQAYHIDLAETWSPEQVKEYS
jgi:hypothetical protein